MIQRLTCAFPDQPETYEIEIQSGFMYKAAEYLASIASRFAIIADEQTARLYGEKLADRLSSSGFEVGLFSFLQGEGSKTRETKEILENSLFEKGFGRDICVIALGGGVTTDLAGFVAATYCRGVPLVMMPTSLLAMVDASIGGKTGVNLPYGKNLIGCFYQPKRVMIDTETLKTLPVRELRNGIVEMIKHGLIADSRYFSYLESHSKELLALDPEVINRSVFESCRIKKEIIELDAHESGKRRLLNFGHTVGHALEKVSQYSISHGEAVAIGILVESYLAVHLGYLEIETLEKIRSIFLNYSIPLTLPQTYSAESIMDAMALDKKSLKGAPRFVIINDIGFCANFESEYCTSVDEKDIIKALRWMSDDLCSN